MDTLRAGIVGAIAWILMGSVSPAPTLRAQEPTRTEKGLYLPKVVEPAYDVTITETERGDRYSVLEVAGLVPTVTAGGTVLLKAIYGIAKERGFEHTFYLPPRQGQPAGVLRLLGLDCPGRS